jgi:hypothetical protein
MMHARRRVDILVRFAAFTSLLWMAGCVVSREVYVQDVKTAGILDDLPVYVTDSVRSGEIRITPRVHIGTTTTYTGVLGSHTKVNAAGVFQVDTLRAASSTTYRETAGANQNPFQGNNFTWSLPPFSLGLDAQIAATRNLALTAGGTYAVINGSAFLAAHAGIGVCAEGRGLSVRFDGGIAWRTIDYTMEEVVVMKYQDIFNDQSSSMRFYADRDNRMETGWYAALTLNTRSEGSPVMGFLMLSLIPCDIIDYSPKPYMVGILDSRGLSETNTSPLSDHLTMFSVTPGVAVNIGGGRRVLAGVRIASGSDIQQPAPGVLITPFLEFDLPF